MNKEKFMHICQNVASSYDNNTPQGAELSKSEMLKLCNLFFESNVVIPKGENRHPYADVLHEWIEGAEVEFTHDEGADAWKLFSTNSIEKFRIKPSEPVYEWQFEFIDKEFKIVTSFMTDEELIQKRESGKIPKKVYIKKPETKRERKQ